MLLQQAVRNVFFQLEASLEQLSTDDYINPRASLSNNSIGQHVRHIVELFQCLELGYSIGTVNYENRNRDKAIETDKILANNLLQQIAAELLKENKDLILEAHYGGDASDLLRIQTNYYREIAYNLEHTIHHMALIRVGLNELSSFSLPEDFGVAPSTVKYRKECAQ